MDWPKIGPEVGPALDGAVGAMGQAPEAGIAEAGGQRNRGHRRERSGQSSSVCRRGTPGAISARAAGSRAG